jgi:tetratricopeptide (TPR) repeat protein
MKNSYILLVFFLFSYSFYGQKSQVAKADKKYDKMEYIDAIKIYERVANKGFVDADVFKKIANAYYFNADLKSAAAWYEKLFKFDVFIDSDYYFRYSQSLKSLGLYDEAAKMLDKFHQINKNDTRGIKYESNKDYLNDIQLNSGRFKIENISTINSKYSDYGAVFFGEFIVFTSARDTGAIANRKHKWTNKSFTNLYQANFLKNGSFVEPHPFSNEIQSIFNESTPVFTKDGKTIYFTRNNYKKKTSFRNCKKSWLGRL